MEAFSQEYILPWVINIALTAAIFIVGRLVVKLLMNVIGRLLRKTKMDVMLINFIYGRRRKIDGLSIGQVWKPAADTAAGLAEELRRRRDADRLPSLQGR
jgi:hypothetical protein